MLKILCLNPPFMTEYGRFSRSSRSPAIAKSGTLYYPIWLCYAAAGLLKAGFEVSLIDSCAYGYDLDETLKRVAGYRPDLVIIDTSTPSIYNDVAVAAGIKGMLPDSFIALMGTHPTALSVETLDLDPSVDAVIMGEADRTVVALARTLASLRASKNAKGKVRKMLASIDGIAYRGAGRVIVNPERPLIEDLDELPFVSMVYSRFLDVRKYFFAASDYPEVQIITARGCVARCTFCVYPQTIHRGKYRMRSYINIADEFGWIVKNMPQVREIGIEDDTFTGNEARVVDFCRELIGRGLSIKWYCNVRVSLTLDTMRWMKRAGCVLVTVGYESADDGILKGINKRTTEEMILTFSRNAQSTGLLVHGCFMAGNIGETRETLDKSLRLALRLMDDTMQFFPLMAYPGTIDYERAKEAGLLTVRSYADFLTEDGNHNSVLRTADMSSTEIRKWCDYARKRYYLRPAYIAYKAVQILKNPGEIRRTAKSARRFLKFLLR